MFYHFCFQCASLCISFLYQLFNVTALEKILYLRNIRANLNYYPILIINYLKQNGENKLKIYIVIYCNILIIMIFINVSIIVNLTICLTSLLN